MRSQEKLYFPVQIVEVYDKIKRMFIEEFHFIYDSKGHVRMYKSLENIVRYMAEKYDAVLVYKESDAIFLEK